MANSAKGSLTRDKQIASEHVLFLRFLKYIASQWSFTGLLVLFLALLVSSSSQCVLVDCGIQVFFDKKRHSSCVLHLFPSCFIPSCVPWLPKRVVVSLCAYCTTFIFSVQRVCVCMGALKITFSSFYFSFCSHLCACVCICPSLFSFFFSSYISGLFSFKVRKKFNSFILV
uniref:Uncharacterized protein n=1 Tax=Rhipicephalus microplus TaxID=6941 RepID=A0A6G5AHT9_RHIMP